MPGKTAKVFVSHDAADVEIAKLLVSLLKEVGVPGADIFCTSVPGHRVPSGQNFSIYIKEQFTECDVVVALVSKNYLDSPFCLCEAGAVWITASKHFFPLVIPPASFSDFDGALYGVQGIRIDSSADLSELRDCLNELLGTKACTTPMWEVPNHNDGSTKRATSITRKSFLQKLTLSVVRHFSWQCF
jgi:hypothetical protein